MIDGVIDIATKYWKQSGNCLTIYDKVLYILYMELIKNKENNLRSNDFTQKVAKYDILVVTALRNFANFYLTEWSMTVSGVYWQNYVIFCVHDAVPFIKHHQTSLLLVSSNDQCIHLYNGMPWHKVA